MKPTLTGLSQKYVAGLRQHLGRGARAPLTRAIKLGRWAAALGLETLALARIHEQALARLKLSGHALAVVRAGRFFHAVAAQAVAAHRAARQRRLNQLNQELIQRTAELATTKRRLRRDILQRQKMESRLKNNGAHSARLLRDSLRQQAGLRQRAHRALAAQEKARQQNSRVLQNDIAQTLLGINVRLLTMKEEARHAPSRLHNEIASAQCLVVKSAKSVRRAARHLKNA